MGKRTIIPFGPQHPVLPEPIHLDLVLVDETVESAIPRIGYIHRGLEKLVEKKDFQQYTYVAERICGICSFMHGMSYCMAIEEIMEVKVPERAEFLRTIWAELSRLHSHLLWLGLLADAFGFESLFMQSWKMREQILDIFEETTGGRVIFSVCDIGGVRKDIDADTLNN
jgi:ech hydrogenase subunit E